jgi:putative ATPase
MADLFDSALPTPPTGNRPLADRLRPKTLGEVIGQGHVLGPSGPLGAMIAARSLSSVILWGPPGVGKTTIARLLADATDLAFVQISALPWAKGVVDFIPMHSDATQVKLVLKDEATKSSLLQLGLKKYIFSTIT